MRKVVNFKPMITEEEFDAVQEIFLWKEPFNALLKLVNVNSGAGSRTRTYEARSARDLQSLVIATRRFQQYYYYTKTSPEINY